MIKNIRFLMFFSLIVSVCPVFSHPTLDSAAKVAGKIVDVFQKVDDAALRLGKAVIKRNADARRDDARARAHGAYGRKPQPNGPLVKFSAPADFPLAITSSSKVPGVEPIRKDLIVSADSKYDKPACVVYMDARGDKGFRSSTSSSVASSVSYKDSDSDSESGSDSEDEFFEAKSFNDTTFAHAIAPLNERLPGDRKPQLSHMTKPVAVKPKSVVPVVSVVSQPSAPEPGMTKRSLAPEPGMTKRSLAPEPRMTKRPRTSSTIEQSTRVTRSSQRALRPRNRVSASQFAVPMDLDPVDMDIDVLEEPVAMDEDPVAMDIDSQNRMTTRPTKRVTRSGGKALAVRPNATVSQPSVAVEPKRAVVKSRERVRSHSATPALKQETYARDARNQALADRKAAAQAEFDASERNFQETLSRAKELSATSVRSSQAEQVAKLEEQAMLKRMELVQAMRERKPDDVIFRLNGEAGKLKEALDAEKRGAAPRPVSSVQDRLAAFHAEQKAQADHFDKLQKVHGDLKRRVAHQAEQKELEDSKKKHEKRLKAVHDELKVLFELQRSFLENDEMELEDARSKKVEDMHVRARQLEKANQIIADYKKRKEAPTPLMQKVEELAAACSRQKAALGKDALRMRFSQTYSQARQNGHQAAPVKLAASSQRPASGAEDLAKRRAALRHREAYVGKTLEVEPLKLTKPKNSKSVMRPVHVRPLGNS